MGLYVIPCPQCKKLHNWFSGNLSQLCGGCRELYSPEEIVVNGLTYTVPRAVAVEIQWLRSLSNMATSGGAVE